VKIRDIIMGEDYRVTVPRRRELASDAERQLADHSLTASVVLEDSLLLYHFPVGQHPTWGFRARVVTKSLPCGKTDLGVMVEFTYRIGWRDDDPERTETRVIHASRVLATWDDWLLDKAARELERERARAHRAQESEQRCARGESTEPASSPRPATVVGGWTVCGRAGRVWLHRDGDGDGDLSPATAERLATALRRAAAEARRPPDRSWTRARR
jgi:hypothetical protein